MEILRDWVALHSFAKHHNRTNIVIHRAHIETCPSNIYTPSPETQTASNCSPTGHAKVVRDQRLTGLRRIEAVDPEDPTEGDGGIPPGGGGRSPLMISWIEASRASTLVDIWFIRSRI